MTNQNTYPMNFTSEDLAWEKCNNLIPVIVQHYKSGLVLMQGFMDKAALAKTLEIGKVTFYSRTKNRLWTKGEESRHYLNLKAMTTDCDRDCILIAVDPIGPTCHRGTTSCFDGHMPLTTDNIAKYEANSANVSQDALAETLANKIAELKNSSDKAQTAADALKTFIDLAQSYNISLADINSKFSK